MPVPPEKKKRYALYPFAFYTKWNVNMVLFNGKNNGPMQWLCYWQWTLDFEVKWKCTRPIKIWSVFWLILGPVFFMNPEISDAYSFTARFFRAHCMWISKTKAWGSRFIFFFSLNMTDRPCATWMTDMKLAAGLQEIRPSGGFKKHLPPKSPFH